MTSRVLILKESKLIIKCPKCGNNTKFLAYSDYCTEDCCEVWVECKDCGYDPTAELIGYRFEDVWGGVHDDNVNMAIDCWNIAIIENLKNVEIKNEN